MIASPENGLHNFRIDVKYQSIEEESKESVVAEQPAVEAIAAHQATATGKKSSLKNANNGSIHVLAAD